MPGPGCALGSGWTQQVRTQEGAKQVLEYVLMRNAAGGVPHKQAPRTCGLIWKQLFADAV